MANKFARSNGDFNNASIWSLLAGSMSATSVPTIGDNASANTFTIQITGNVTCDNITNGTAYGGTAGGAFNLNNQTSLSATIVSNAALIAGSVEVAVLSGNNSAEIYGNVTGGGSSAQRCITHSSTGSLFVRGNITGNGGSGSQSILFINNAGSTVIEGNLTGNSNAAIQHAGTGPLTITGNLQGAGIGRTLISSSGATTIYGNVLGSSSNNASNPTIGNSLGVINIFGNVSGVGNASAIENTSTGSISIFGNINGAAAAGLSNASIGSVTVLGNVIGDFRGGAGIASTNAGANVKISGNLIGAPNGIPAVYAASYTVNPVPYQTYIRYANNGTGVGSDAYLYHYTTDSLSAFSMPPVSSVRAGLQYADNTLTGTCQIPAVSSVAFGAFVDNTTGTAILTSNNLWETPISSLTATNSIGARLKNSATIESVGKILASFTF
jgi:hypothetical protein